MRAVIKCVGLGAILAMAFTTPAHLNAAGSLKRIGILASNTCPGPKATLPLAVTLSRRLTELGWIDGINLTIDFANGETSEQLYKVAARLIGRPVDVILAAGPELGAKAASEATHTIPIVIVALNYDPIEKKYVASLARPGRNITGVFFRNLEVGAKQLELLHAAIPGAARVGVLWTKFSADQIPSIEAVASRLQVQLEKVELFINAIRANEICQEPRKDFNLCRARTPIGLIPELCLKDARSIVDCFQKVFVKKKKLAEASLHRTIQESFELSVGISKLR